MGASSDRSRLCGDENHSLLRVLIAKPRGFCAGVDRAIRMLTETLARFGPPVYARHAIVHNPQVVADFERRGVIFIEESEQAPPGSVVVFSAHGVSLDVESGAEALGLSTVDTTCPLVRKVHAEVRHHAAAGRRTILIGHAGHPEVLGTIGQVPPGQVILVSDPAAAEAIPIDLDQEYGLAMQTTLSVDDAESVAFVLKLRGARLIEPARDDICYATTNRQRAVKEIASECDAFIVIGGRKSSNSQRLAEVAAAAGCARVKMIESEKEFAAQWLDGVTTLGVSAGASTPEASVQALLHRVADLRVTVVEERGEDEDVFFSGRLTLARPLDGRASTPA